MARFARLAWAAACALTVSAPSMPGLAAQSPAQPPRTSETSVPRQARGSFQPTVTPLPPPDGDAAASHGRYSLTKTWSGGMQGVSAGELLGTLQEGSGAYVAIERFSGTLDGRAGAFSLVHRGEMTAGGAPDLLITIAPGTGEGDLAGITGSLTLDLAGGRHDYRLDYVLPARSPQPR